MRRILTPITWKKRRIKHNASTTSEIDNINNSEENVSASILDVKHIFKYY